MQTTLTAGTDVPTALPDIEPEDDREKMLLEGDNELIGDEEDEVDEMALEAGSERKGSRTAKALKTVAAFTVFLFLLGTAITWFFGMGWFASQKPQSVNRTGGKEASPAPMTEDEKLKAALTMVASKEPNPSKDSVVNPPEDMTVDKMTDVGQSSDISLKSGSRSGIEPPDKAIGTGLTARETITRENGPPDNQNKELVAKVGNAQVSQTSSSFEPLGRSLFFGISKTKNEQTGINKAIPLRASTEAMKLKASRQALPFGSLLPVRLIGAIYTLRSSGGAVRLELTQPIEGKGYSYPAGTQLIGNLRGGESTRAFVSVVGLIDPVSGELVKFTGELMGTDGASGIKGNQKRMTGKWTRFFRGLKETAGSILGSVGSFRSGGTIVLSEPLRRGSERLSEDTSQSLFGTEREDTFLEVLAGTSGYVLVTQMPETTTSVTTAATGADK